MNAVCRLLQAVLSMLTDSLELPWVQRNNWVWALTCGHYEDGQSRDEAICDVLLPREISSLQEIEKKIIAAREGGYPIRVFLLELVLSYTGETLRREFLTDLSAVLEKEIIALAVDDIMAGLRCGHHFSVSMYGMRRMANQGEIHHFRQELHDIWLNCIASIQTRLPRNT